MSGPSFTKLLNVLKFIKTSNLSGSLIIANVQQKVLLYFKQGNLTDAQGSSSSGEEVLYSLLNWKEGSLEWQSGNASQSHTIDSQQEADFYQAVEDLAGLGYFEKSNVSDAQIKTFLSETPSSGSPPPVPAAFIPPAPVVAGSLFLPPGRPFSLSGNNDFVSELIQQLGPVRFTGYVSLKVEPGDDLKVGILALENGRLVASFAQRGGQEYRGAVAWQMLSQLRVQSGYRLMSVKPDVMSAWRALLGSSHPYTNLAATFANFKGLVNTFERSANTGVIQIKLEQVVLFQFIFEGRELGTYGIEPGTNQLRYLGGGLTLLLENPQAKLDVFVTRNEELENSQSILSSSEINTLAFTLQAVIGLMSTLIPPAAALERLAETIDRIGTKYPFLKELSGLDLQKESDQQTAMLTQWLSGLKSPPRSQAFDGLAELLEQYLQPTCLQIGPAIFHQMVLRALGPDQTTNLRKIGLKVDFFDLAEPPSLLQMPANQGLEPDLIGQNEENPYDF